MAKTLPDPFWLESPERCALCGYSLVGHAAPGRCSECGTPFAARQLTLHGVPHRRSGGSLLRRMLWLVLLAGSVAYFELLFYFVVRQRLIALIGLLCILALLTALMLTSRRERRGAERFVLTPHGIFRLPLAKPNEPEQHDSILIPWSDAGAFELRRISNVWRRLRIRGRDAQGRPSGVIFDAGIRCPEAAVGELCDAVREYIAQANPGGMTSGEET